jgi:hypothetical protein
MELVTTGIKDMVTVVGVGCGITVVEGVAETRTAMVIHELVTTEAASVGLGVNANFVEGVASRFVHKFSVAKVVGCIHRKRTVAIAIAIFIH